MQSAAVLQIRAGGMDQRHVQGCKRQFLRVLSPMSPIAICASARRYTIRRAPHTGTRKKKQEKRKRTKKKKKNKRTKPSRTKNRKIEKQSHSHFGAHLKSDMANIRRRLGVIDGLCTSLDIGIDAVEVRGSESVEVVQTVERDRVLWR